MGLCARCTGKVYLDKVQRLQNRAARIVSGNYDWTIRGIDIVKLLNWQTVRERRDYFTSLLMYRCMAGTAPFYLSSHFNHVTHEYFTRSSMYDLDVPKPNREIFRPSIVYQGAVAWNGLDNDLKCCDSITSFKQLYKASTCM